MFSIRNTVFALTIAAAFTLSIAAQAQTPAPKIVIINSAAFFNEKTGIAKIVAASKALTNDVAARRNDVQQLIARAEAVNKEVETFRLNANNGVPIDQRTFQAKVDELERLKREGKYKEDDFNAFAQKRQDDIVGPVYAEVLKALSEYIKTKDYGILFDASKDQNGFLIYASDKYDITREFIAYYNARPVTAIAPVPR